MLEGLNFNQDGVAMLRDKKTGKKMPVLVKKCRGMDGGIKTQTMMPSIILDMHRDSPTANASTWGGTIREPIRTALRIADNSQRRVISKLPNRK